MGKVMLMPEHDPTADLIMVGMGTVRVRVRVRAP